MSARCKQRFDLPPRGLGHSRSLIGSWTRSGRTQTTFLRLAVDMVGGACPVWLVRIKILAQSGAVASKTLVRCIVWHDQ